MTTAEELALIQRVKAAHMREWDMWRLEYGQAQRWEPGANEPSGTHSLRAPSGEARFHEIRKDSAARAVLVELGLIAA